jgi:hypothetical protein
MLEKFEFDILVSETGARWGLAGGGALPKHAFQSAA